ncbi:MAG: DNA-directed RNA polymerase subunit RpoH/Rpb5 C-terminal domain-containing protein [Candidatus Burarchaeum sp.]|nr:DNA-directed RNA polymerase subunit RpoH/Rpb5 C-terminal domain-containing protein [Candidatus Burarchaeum sp.]MDO8339509.1 DNA-directed RNA polymerase subunit RpoH/Rpb5 C-terminal domain-containing protein [Candidatus Burarchaeum sp.]
MAESPEHILIPVHEILSGGEREKFFSESGLKPEQLPKISANDVIIKGMAEPGDVVRIIRKGDVDKKIEIRYYRLVIE